MLNADKKDEASQQKLAEVLCWATEALPNSEKLWCSRLKYLLKTNIDESGTKILEQVIKNRVYLIKKMRIAKPTMFLVQ